MNAKTCLVTVVGPDHEVDLQLPSSAPICDYLERLIELCVDAGTPHIEWTLSLLGDEPLSLSSTLADGGIFDGATVYLVDAQRPLTGHQRPSRMTDADALPRPHNATPSLSSIPTSVTIRPIETLLGGAAALATVGIILSLLALHVTTVQLLAICCAAFTIGGVIAVALRSVALILASLSFVILAVGCAIEVVAPRISPYYLLGIGLAGTAVLIAHIPRIASWLETALRRTIGSDENTPMRAMIAAWFAVLIAGGLIGIATSGTIIVLAAATVGVAVIIREGIITDCTEARVPIVLGASVGGVAILVSLADQMTTISRDAGVIVWTAGALLFATAILLVRPAERQ